MNYVNCALIVVVLVLVVMCCMNKSNEGFAPGDQRKQLKKTCKVASDALAEVARYGDCRPLDPPMIARGLVKGDFAKCAKKGLLLPGAGWDAYLNY